MTDSESTDGWGGTEEEFVPTFGREDFASTTTTLPTEAEKIPSEEWEGAVEEPKKTPQLKLTNVLRKQPPPVEGAKTAIETLKSQAPTAPEETVQQKPRINANELSWSEGKLLNSPHLQSAVALSLKETTASQRFERAKLLLRAALAGIQDVSVAFSPMLHYSFEQMARNQSTDKTSDALLADFEGTEESHKIASALQSSLTSNGDMNARVPYVDTHSLIQREEMSSAEALCAFTKIVETCAAVMRAKDAPSGTQQNCESLITASKLYCTSLHSSLSTEEKKTDPVVFSMSLRLESLGLN